MSALVLGASGFLGRQVAARLATRQGNEPLYSASRAKAGPGVGETHVPTDLTDPAQVRRLVETVRPSYVYHLAGTSRVNPTATVPDYFPSNFLTTARLLEALEARREPVTLFFASTVHVYGNQAGLVDEASSLRPVSPYGFTKYLAEEALRRASSRSPLLRIVIGRIYNCLGPGQSPGFVASDLASRIAASPSSPSTLKLATPSSFRRFLDVRDAAEIVCLLTALGTEIHSGLETFHVASPYEKTIRELAEALVALSGKPIQLDGDPSDGNTFLGLRLNMSKLERTLGGFQFRPLERTLAEMMQTPENLDSGDD